MKHLEIRASSYTDAARKCPGCQDIRRGTEDEIFIVRYPSDIETRLVKRRDAVTPQMREVEQANRDSRVYQPFTITDYLQISAT